MASSIDHTGHAGHHTVVGGDLIPLPASMHSPVRVSLQGGTPRSARPVMDTNRLADSSAQVVRSCGCDRSIRSTVSPPPRSGASGPRTEIGTTPSTPFGLIGPVVALPGVTWTCGPGFDGYVVAVEAEPVLDTPRPRAKVVCGMESD